MEEIVQNFEKRFLYKQILDFHCPSKILCHTSNYEILSKSLVPNVQYGSSKQCSGPVGGVSSWAFRIRYFLYGDPNEKNQGKLSFLHHCDFKITYYLWRLIVNMPTVNNTHKILVLKNCFLFAS
jgi:hypothetical protein